MLELSPIERYGIAFWGYCSRELFVNTVVCLLKRSVQFFYGVNNFAPILYLSRLLNILIVLI